MQLSSLENKPSWLRVVLILFLALIGVYVGVRAYLVPVFSDEAFTFFSYVQTGSFMPFRAYLNANNHVFNSALAYFSFSLFGDGAFWLRIPNILGYSLFSISLIGFGSFFRRTSTWFGLVFTLTFSHYLLDFFSLCRGYGLSFGLLTLALLYLLRYAKGKRTINAAVSMLLLSFALWSNLALMTTTLSIGGVIALLWIFDHRETQLGNRKVVAFLFSLIILFLTPHVIAVVYALELQNTDMLYVGGTSGFYSLVVQSLLSELDGSFNWYSWVLKSVTMLFIVLSILSIFKLKNSRNLLIVQSAFWGSILGIVLMHHLLDVYYPVERAAAHLIILLFLSFFFLLDRMDKKSFSIVGLSLAFCTGIVFVTKANVSHTQHWYTEAVPTQVRKILLEWKSENNRSPTLSAHVLQKRVLSYQDYLAERHLPLQMEDLRQSEKVDFILTDTWSNTYPTGYDTVYYHGNTKLALLKRRKTVEWTEVHKQITEPTSFAEEYQVLADFDLKQDATPSSLLTKISISASSAVCPLRLWVVTKISDEKGKNILQTSTGMQPSLGDIKTTTTVELTQILDNIPNESHSVTVFVWNMDKVAIELSRATTSVQSSIE